MQPIKYEPTVILRPPHVLEGVPTAWAGLESILHDLTTRFCKHKDFCVEFGVEFGYSTVALSNFFRCVIGVDTFMGDQHSGRHDSIYEETKHRLSPYKNIALTDCSWQEFTTHRLNLIDLIHIDIEHTHEQTFGCGDWACKHAPVVIFHDTSVFPEVRQAVTDLSDKHNMTFYNYDPCCGLGILVKE